MLRVGLLLFGVLFNVFTFVATEQYRICATDANADACQQIARDLELACNTYLHNVDCLLSIQSNVSHVGRITGEEAFLGSNLLSDDVVVLGEIKSRHVASDSVVIVKNDIPSGFVNLKDKKLCHPGYKHDALYSHLTLQELENKIIELNTSFCANDNATLLEKHVQTLATFFGPSCRPGPWSQNENFDVILQQKYPSLCSLCGGDKCAVDYIMPFNDSLKCLLNKDADVAVTTLNEAYKFFNISEDKSQQYKYLCQDGTSRAASAPCIWSSELPDLIVGERSAADFIRNYLQNKLGTKVENNSGSPNELLVNILRISERRETIVLLQNGATYKSLKDYVKERRSVPTLTDSKRCDRSLKWCTYTDLELEKCRWLSQAAMNWGIQPVVECTRSEGYDELSCLDDIKKKNADIVVASSDYAYISLNKGLKSLAYPETKTTFLSTIITVKRADDDSVKSLQDLKGKSACIPRYGGKEHLAFIDTLRNRGIADDTNCDYGRVLNDFIGASCVPGVRSSFIKESTEYVDKDKLCETCRSVTISQTSTYCNDDSENKYFGSNGTLKCLYEKSGDFAVISKFDIDAQNGSFYQVICKNNSLAAHTGLQVDANCALNIIPNSEIVTEADNSKNPDIILALTEFERWFGTSLKKPFHLFDVFNGTLDLLFKDSTPGLGFKENEYINNYRKLLQDVKECKETSSSSTVMSFTIVTFFISLFALLSIR